MMSNQNPNDVEKLKPEEIQKVVKLSDTAQYELKELMQDVHKINQNFFELADALVEAQTKLSQLRKERVNKLSKQKKVLDHAAKRAKLDEEKYFWRFSLDQMAFIGMPKEKPEVPPEPPKEA